MMIQVNGQNVQVDDAYANLTPEEQMATQQEIAQSMGMHQQQQQAQAREQQQQANPGPMDMANGQSAVRQAIDPALATAAVAVPAAGVGYKLYKGAQLASSAIDYMKGGGAVDPTKVAKGATKVADMASSSAFKDIALQGIQRGVQGAAAVAGAIAPYVRGLSGAALMLHSKGLNEGEDEMIRRMHEQQQATTGGPVMPGQF